MTALVWAAPAPAVGDEPPTPRLDRVDYANPRTCIAIGPEIGAGQRTHGIARQLVGGAAPSAATLGKILHWCERNLRIDRGGEASWRSIDDIVRQGRVGSDGDRAYALGILTRAAGIPVAWVKAVSEAWLIAAKGGRAHPDAETRTFLEVFLDDRWQLLDPITARLYGSYDRSKTEMPEGYLAYDKGHDPYSLVLDNRPAMFRAQLDRFVASYPLRDQPFQKALDLLAPWRVYVTGQGGAATYAREAARTLGFTVEASFDSQWEQNVAAVRGHKLLVTSRGNEPMLPESLREALLPRGWRSAYAAAAQGGKGWVAHTLSDGTRVILIVVSEYGPVELAVSEALEG
ncbi:MAG: hypothetical protein O2894_08985 [Planctomycetota bacterium]|nr:hypothetical protein [Planctomycetota bacterium]